MVASKSWLRAAAAAAAALAVAAAPAGAQTQNWAATLSGPAESPPVASPGTGHAEFSLTGNLLSINVTFRDLLAGTTQSHIHCCTAVAFTGTAGVATQVPTFVGWPIGSTSGFYSNVFDLSLASSYNPAFITANGGSVDAARTALLNGMNSGQTYLNIHTSAFPGGEIRGFIVVIPEPATVLLLGTGIAAIGGAAARRRRAAAAAAGA